VAGREAGILATVHDALVAATLAPPRRSDLVGSTGARGVDVMDVGLSRANRNGAERRS
jgi:hypothetical protein